MFLRFRRRMLTYIAFSALFLITFFLLAGEDLAPDLQKHVDYVVDKTKAQWDFDPRNGGIKPEDAALQKGPDGGIPGKVEVGTTAALRAGTYKTTNALGVEVIATSSLEPGTYLTTNTPGFEIIATSAKQEVVGQVTTQTVAPDATRTHGPVVPIAGATDGAFEPAHQEQIVVGEKPQKDGTDSWYLPEHWVKQSEKFPVAPEKLIKLPTGTAERMPAIQATFAPESEMQKQTRMNRQSKVKEEFQHAWKGYKSKAWTHDEVRPVTGGVRDPFCGWAATIVDALDTMWIMGLKRDFEEAVEEVGKIDFTTTPREQIPMFETTIRYLGGMLAAYDVSGGNYPVLLEKAKELAEILMGAFDTPNRMPVLYYSWKPLFAMQAKRAGSHANFAELSSLTMEFTRLAQLTGEDKYYDAVARITNELVDWQKRGTKLPGVFPFTADAQGCNKSNSAHSSTTSSTSAPFFFEEPESNVYKDAEAPEEGGLSDPLNVSKRAGGLSEHATPTLRDPSKDWDCAPQGVTGQLTGRESFSMGGGQDSGYEYFLKMHLLLGGLEPKYKGLYKGTIGAIKNYMLYRPMIPDENRSILFTNKISTFGHPEQPGDMQFTYEITHLTCFVGGMVGMGAQVFQEPEELGIAERLTDGCVYAYSATKSGIMPELARAVPCNDVIDCKWDEALWHRYLDPMTPEDRQRDIDIWDRKMAVQQKSQEKAAAEKAEEDAVVGAKATENLIKGRKKLDATYAAYSYRTQPGTQPEITAEEKAKIDEVVSKEAALRNEDYHSTTESQVANAPEKPKEAASSEKMAAVEEVPAEVKQEAASNDAAKPAQIDVDANPDDHAAASDDAVVVEPVAKADGHGLRKREAIDHLDPQKPKSERVYQSPPIDGSSTISTVKTGAQTAAEAMAPVEADGMVGGAPPHGLPALPVVDPEDRIQIDMPRPKSHEEFVQDRIAHEAMPRAFAGMSSTAYILRPEAIESVWYMHRITGDPQWAEKGWEMFQAIIRNTKTEYGHSAIHDVNAQPTEKVDSMESFWLAETLKYFYLLYSEPDLISLDDWVLNTEAHPFRRPSAATLAEEPARIKKVKEWEKTKERAAANAVKAKAQHDEYLKRLEEIERAKAAGAGRGGVVAKLANLPDTPVDYTDAELKQKQEEYWKKVNEYNKAHAAEGAAQAAAPVPVAPGEPVKGEAAPPPEMDLFEYAAKAKAGAWAAKVAKLQKLEADMASGEIGAQEAAKIAKELKEDGIEAPEAPAAAKPANNPVAKPAAAAVPAADPVVVAPEPLVAVAPAIPAAPAPAAVEVAANPEPPLTKTELEDKGRLEEYHRMLESMGGPDKDRQAYEAQAKEDAVAAKLKKLQKLEADMADGSIDAVQAAKVAKELKEMKV